MRKRFNRNIIASSDPYKAHSHKHMLEENHNENIEYLHNIDITIHVNIRKTPYIKVFGKLIKLTEDEVNLHTSLNIIWK